MTVAEVKAGKSFYTAARPTRAMPSLTNCAERTLQNVTPRSLEVILLKRLGMASSGELYDRHPLLQHLHAFPSQDISIVGSGNREVFYHRRIDLRSFGAVREPQSIVMCDPTHFFDGFVTVETNHWMHTDMPVSRESAVRQWGFLRSSIERIMPVDVISSSENLPDMVFVDQGLAVPDRTSDRNIFIPSSMLSDHRKGEVPLVVDFFKSRGYEVRPLNFREEEHFEANGDCHVVPGISLLLMGFGYRSSNRIAQELQEKTGYNVLPLELSGENGVYHLDTVSSIVNNETLLVYAAGLKPESLAIMLMLFTNFYLISNAEAHEEFTPNSKAFRDVFVTQTTVSEAFLQFIGRQVREVVQVDMSEFNKSGGGINCCSKLAPHLSPGYRIDLGCFMRVMDERRDVERRLREKGR